VRVRVRVRVWVWVWVNAYVSECVLVSECMAVCAQMSRGG